MCSLKLRRTGSTRLKGRKWPQDDPEADRIKIVAKARGGAESKPTGTGIAA